MSFLAPLFMLGAAAVAGPILFHLIRRTSREKTPFSSMMFLTPSPPRVTKRSRLEHVFLLLLRCLVLLLLAAGFARPFFADADDDALKEGTGRRTLVLVDTSASMQRAGVWTAAVEAFDEVLKDGRAEDAVALYRFDHALRPIVSFARINEAAPAAREQLLRDEFGKLKPGWGSTRLGMVLARAAGLLEELNDEEERSTASRVVLISDLPEGSELAELQAFEWPEEFEVKLKRVAAKKVGNAGIQYLPPSPNEAGAKERDRVKVRVFNSAETAGDQFQVAWADASGKRLGKAEQVYVPAGQSRVVALERSKDPGAVRVTLFGDAEPFDNDAWIVPPRPRVVDVVYAGDDRADDVKAPFFFLNGALPETRDFRFEVTREDAQLNPRGLTVATGALSKEAAGKVRAFIEAGGVALLAPRDVAAMATVFEVFEAAPLGIEEVVPARYALLGEIDFQHPLFAPFRDPRFSDFSKIHFWRYRRFPVESLSNARVLARFDNDDPAMVQVPLGEGFALLLAGCWHPADSQLALSTKFVPLIHSLLDLSGVLNRAPRQHLVGGEVPLASTNAVSVTRPDGETSSEMKVDQPGLYSVSSGTNRFRFAANIDPRESRVDALPAEELERYGVTLHEVRPETLSDEKKRELKHSELEQRQKLWRWLIAAALVLLSIEILMAGRLARRPATTTAAPAS